MTAAHLSDKMQRYLVSYCDTRTIDSKNVDDDLTIETRAYVSHITNKVVAILRFSFRRSNPFANYIFVKLYITDYDIEIPNNN